MKKQKRDAQGKTGKQTRRGGVTVGTLSEAEREILRSGSLISVGRFRVPSQNTPQDR